MKKILLSLALSLSLCCAVNESWSQSGVPNSGGAMVPIGPVLGFTPAQVFNISDSGAVCDGTTNDNTAINAALTAAAGSNAYQNNNAISIVGPSSGSQKGCVINSLNLTQFNKGTAANSRPRVEISNMTLLCTGAGNVCLDGLNADFINLHDISIRGDTSPNSPEIGIQIGISSQNTSSAWHVFERVNVNGDFALANYYNIGSENFNCYSCFFTNAHTANGPIGTLGSITAGSSYTNGTYTGVSLTGGSGTGAKATIVVSGNAVTSVTVTYQGRDYVAADSLSAAAANIGGTGSGFSVPVSTVTPYTAIFDGQNHWHVTSAFTSVTTPVDTWESFTIVNFWGGSIRQNGAGQAAIWAGRTMGLRLNRSYLYGGASTPSYCAEMFDNGISKAGPATGNSSFYFDGGCEGAISATFLFDGGNTTPVLDGFTYLTPQEPATSSRPVFAELSGITGITVLEGSLRIDQFINSGAVIFKTPSLWTISGTANVQLPENWNTPLSFSGTLCANGACKQFPIVGPGDIFTSMAGAWSCSRRLVASYSGALCNVQRTSDNATSDIGIDGLGGLNQSTYNTFCASTTCNVKIAYDQSGNGNNATQATAASQPQLVLSDASLGNRPAMLFGDSGAGCLSVTAASAVNGTWTAGGLASLVVHQNATPTNTDRLLYKSNASALGWELRQSSVSHAELEFLQNSSGGNGDFITNTVLSNSARTIDVLYSSASLANVPTIAASGVNQVLGTSTAPIGTIGVDTAQNLLIGNNACSSGTRGYPGYIAEAILWASQPTTFILESIRQNQASYYGLSGIQ